MNDPNIQKYHSFVTERLQMEKRKFQNKFRDLEAQELHSGLYCLLRLSQDPSEKEIRISVSMYLKFIDLMKELNAEYKKSLKQEDQNNDKLQKGINDRTTAKYNERYFVNVFHSLKYCDEP